MRVSSPSGILVDTRVFLIGFLYFTIIRHNISGTGTCCQVRVAYGTWFCYNLVMKSELQVTTLLWMLSQDPDIGLIKALVEKWEKDTPGLVDIRIAVKELHKVKEAGEEIALRWIVKKMQLMAWFIDEDKLMEEMQAIQYYDDDSLYRQGLLFESRMDTGEVDEQIKA